MKSRDMLVGVIVGLLVGVLSVGTLAVLILPASPRDLITPDHIIGRVSIVGGDRSEFGLVGDDGRLLGSFGLNPGIRGAENVQVGARVNVAVVHVKNNTDYVLWVNKVLGGLTDPTITPSPPPRPTDSPPRSP